MCDCIVDQELAEIPSAVLGAAPDEPGINNAPAGAGAQRQRREPHGAPSLQRAVSQAGRGEDAAPGGGGAGPAQPRGSRDDRQGQSIFLVSTFFVFRRDTECYLLRSHLQVNESFILLLSNSHCYKELAFA